LIAFDTRPYLLWDLSTDNVQEAVRWIQ